MPASIEGTGGVQQWIYPFTTRESPALDQVGGKAASLIAMTRHGLPVPPGVVLTVAFFQPWLSDIQSTPEWTDLVHASPSKLAQSCGAVTALCQKLLLDAERRRTLTHAAACLEGSDGPRLYAVRSSSPEEDLAQASFAGGYQTVLGVHKDQLEDAIRRCFASCFDQHVLLYKRQHGLPRHQCRIAVIIQQQVPADSAGVAFSLNPLNNAYDEAVINANFGLGESVVAGLVSPDTFVVDKRTHQILERKLGSKKTSVWLAPNGGTYEKPAADRSQACLSDQQALQLVGLLRRVEEHFQCPVDMEWACVDHTPYLLQARPITAYIPLPEEMQTQPGEPPILYMDYTLAKQGINYPLSIMGADYWERMQRMVLGDDALFDLRDGLVGTLGGRFYANLSNYLRLQGKDRTASQIQFQDMLSADIIRSIDDVYIADAITTTLKLAVVRTVLSKLRPAFLGLIAYVRPERQHHVFLEGTDALDRDLERIRRMAGGPQTVATCLVRRVARYMNEVSLPVTIAAEIARARIKRLFADEPPEVRAQVIYLERALPHNVTTEMGLALYALACQPEILQCTSPAEFVSRLERKTFSEAFLLAWNMFVRAYGHRSPRELDIAEPRFRETPGLLYEQVRSVAHNTDAQNNPRAVFAQGAAERAEAYNRLLRILEAKGKRYAGRFARNYQVLTTFGGYREIHKFYIIRAGDLLRERILDVAQTLTRAGRLDNLGQAFALTIEELDRARVEPNLDLRALAKKNTRFLRRVNRVHDFPRIIDSRGKILRPPRLEAKQGLLAGQPISPGVVRGRVRVLSRPEEEMIQPGEILVARATDPGWTPLFLNAGGIILEVGGILQHGALVAREYCKPCIAGLEGATKLFSTGQLVELDGANGTVRRLEEVEA